MSLVICKNARIQQNMQIYLITSECSHTSLKEILTYVELINSDTLQSGHLNHSPSLTTIKEKFPGYLKK